MDEERNDKIRRRFANYVRRIKYMNKPEWGKYVLPLAFSIAAGFGLRYISTDNVQDTYDQNSTQQVMIEEQDPLDSLITESHSVIPSNNLEDVIDRPSYVSDDEWNELKNIYTGYTHLEHYDLDVLTQIIDAESIGEPGTFGPESAYVYTYPITKDGYLNGYLRLAFVSDDVIIQYDPSFGKDMYFFVPGNVETGLIVARDYDSDGNLLKEIIMNYLMEGNLPQLSSIIDRPDDMVDYEWLEMEQIFEESQFMPNSDITTLTSLIDINDLTGAYTWQEDSPYVYTYNTYNDGKWTGHLRLAFINDQVIVQYDPLFEEEMYFSLEEHVASDLINAKMQGAKADVLRELLGKHIGHINFCREHGINDTPANLDYTEWQEMSRLFRENSDIESLLPISDLGEYCNLNAIDAGQYSTEKWACRHHYELTDGSNQMIDIGFVGNGAIVRVVQADGSKVFFSLPDDVRQDLANNYQNGNIPFYDMSPLDLLIDHVETISDAIEKSAQSDDTMHHDTENSILIDEPVITAETENSIQNGEQVVVPETESPIQSDYKINYALGANASSSSHYSNYYPSNAIDGDPITVWYAEGNEGTITVDLRKEIMVDEVVLDLCFDACYLSGYTNISVSEDGMNWKSVDNKNLSSNAFNDTYDISHKFEPTNGRYVKIRRGGAEEAIYWHIAEIAVYGSE